MLVIATLLLLNLTPLTWAALPSFLANLEEDATYHMCDSAMCWWTTFDIEIHSDFRVPNSSLVIADYRWDWWEVRMSSLLEECVPSLPISQIAYSFSACNNIEDESVKEACVAVQRDWLDDKGAIKTTLIQTHSELPKAGSFIKECLALGGDDVSEVEEFFDYYNYSDYHDYDDYYDHHDYNWVEEKSGGRTKRSLEGKLKARVAEREERRGRGRKGHRGGKVLEKKRNGKSQRLKGGQKRRTTKERNGPKKKKKNKNKQKKKHKERARNRKKKNKSGRQTSKKKKRKAKQALKKIGLKKMPSQLILGQLKCIWLAVDLALEDCGKSVLKNSNIGNS